MKAFTLGEEKRSTGDSNAAIASFNLAVDLDPQFALAYARLGSLYENSGRSAEGRHAYQKAFELRDRTSDRHLSKYWRGARQTRGAGVCFTPGNLHSHNHFEYRRL